MCSPVVTGATVPCGRTVTLWIFDDFYLFCWVFSLFASCPLSLQRQGSTRQRAAFNILHPSLFLTNRLLCSFEPFALPVAFCFESLSFKRLLFRIWSWGEMYLLVGILAVWDQTLPSSPARVLLGGWRCRQRSPQPMAPRRCFPWQHSSRCPNRALALLVRSGKEPLKYTLRSRATRGLSLRF